MKEKIKQFIIENFKHDITKIENDSICIKGHPLEIIKESWGISVWFLQEEISLFDFQKFHEVAKVRLFHFIYERIFLLSIYKEFIKWDPHVFFRKIDAYTRGQNEIWFGKQKVSLYYKFLYQDEDRDYKPYGIEISFWKGAIRDFEFTSHTGLEAALEFTAEKIKKNWLSQRLTNLITDQTYIFHNWCELAFGVPLDDIYLQNITEKEVEHLFYQYYAEKYPNFSFITGNQTENGFEGVRTKHYFDKCGIVISKA